jgi:hypothetical protein
MAKKRKIIYQEGYIKGVTVSKEEILKAINTPGSSIYIEKVGKYDDGKEFIIIKIDNL